ncbi:MAG: dihydrofolate reductase [Candidatus Marinimicrobia bacterium]|nr:dihydrofolate reductase [Candidatus Neomarinimicrobiota bacterium]
MTIIAAKSKNNVIGKKGKMPWHLPGDLAFFKSKTMGHHVLIGRKTYQNLDIPLKGRNLIIVTKNNQFQSKKHTVAHDLSDAFMIALTNNEKELFIAGGSSIYKQTIEIVDKMYITEIDATIQGDRYFPEIVQKDWDRKKLKEYEQDQSHPYSFTIYEYIRK